jgi:hypothetical protein
MFFLKCLSLSHYVVFGRNYYFGIKTVVLLSVHLPSNNYMPRLVFNAQRNHLHQNSKLDTFFGVVAFIPVISFLETNKLDLGTSLLSCLISKLQKPFSLGLEPRTVFWG